MYKRKIEDTLRKWKENPRRKPIVIKGYNVGRNGALLTIPLYMAFLLTDI